MEGPNATATITHNGHNYDDGTVKVAMTLLMMKVRPTKNDGGYTNF